MPVSFSRGAPAASGPFEAALLPDAAKEELCRSLLAEFGINNIRTREPDGELIHACLIDPTHRRQQAEPTASLNYKKLTYRCLGCGSKGGLLWFIAQCRGESTTEAKRWLATATGTDGNVMELDALMKYLDAVYDTKRVKATIPTYSTRMLEPWNLIHPYLTDPKDAYGRGIPEQNVIQMRVGYAEDYRVGKRADGSWVTSERIVIPHFWKGDLVGWQTRRLDARDGTPKYLSSPDFPKDHTIYNYQPRNERAVVVESMLSVVPHVHALPEMESTFGAGVTDDQTRLLAKHPTLVLFMDNDQAGWKAVEGYDTYWPNSNRVREHTPGLGEILSRSCNVLVVDNPYAADPGDMSTEDVLALVDAAIPFSVWKRPTRLLCYSCKEIAHDGAC
jgi:hypothetical protein